MVASAQAFSLGDTVIGPQALSPPPTRHALLAFLIALAAVLHLGTAGWGDLYNGAEGENAGGAREMLRSHAWLLPTLHDVPQPRKPPLLSWLLVASFKVFGTTATAARLPMAAATIISIALTFLIAERLFDYWRGFLAGFVHLTFLGLFVVGRTVTPEPLWSVAIAGAIFCALCGYAERRKRRACGFGFWICCGVGTLAGGLTALVYPAAICALLAVLHREARLRFRALLWWPNVLIFLAIILPWYLHSHASAFWPLAFGAQTPAPTPPVSRFGLEMAWWLPSLLLVVPALFRFIQILWSARPLPFTDALPLCWLAVVTLPWLVRGWHDGNHLMSMWGGLAILFVSSWDHASARARLIGVWLVVCLGALCGGLWICGNAAPTVLRTFGDIPPSVWTASRPMLAITALSLVITGVSGIYLLIKQRERLALVVVLGAMLPIGLSATETRARLAPLFSLADGARFLNDRNHDHDTVYFEGSVHAGSSLLFYLHRDFELLPPEKPASEDDSLLRRWRATDPVYLIADAQRVPYWRGVLTEHVHIYHQVATCGRHVILSNQF